MTEVQERIYNRCFELKPSWRLNRKTLAKIIKMSDIEGDGYKRITVLGKGTYLVPIEDIICFGVKAEEIPLKYKPHSS